MKSNNEHDALMGAVLAFVLCALVIVVALQQREQREAEAARLAVCHAVEASIGETPKSEGHGR